MSKSVEELATEITCTWLQAMTGIASEMPGLFQEKLTGETIGAFYKQVHRAIWEAIRTERPSPQVGRA